MVNLKPAKVLPKIPTLSTFPWRTLRGMLQKKGVWTPVCPVYSSYLGDTMPGGEATFSSIKCGLPREKRAKSFFTSLLNMNMLAEKRLFQYDTNNKGCVVNLSDESLEPERLVWFEFRS